jgi:hypothetical protein
MGSTAHRRLLLPAACIGALAVIAVALASADRSAFAASRVEFGASAPQRDGESPREAVERIESQIGRPLAIVRVFKRWDMQFPTDVDSWLAASGHRLFLSISAQRSNGQFVPWGWIANAEPGSGLYNTMVRWAKSIKEFGAPVSFSFDPEPETGPASTMGSPAEFVDAWRKMHDIFADVGAMNATWVIVTTAYTYSRTDGRGISAWYPGDGYVDAIGADGYNFFGCSPGVSTAWRSFQQIFDPVRAFGALHPSKPVVVPEWGSVEDPSTPGRKARWIADATATLKSPGWEQFATVVYWNSATSGCSYVIDSSDSSLSAFAAMGGDPYFFDGSPPTIRGFRPRRGSARTVVSVAGTGFSGPTSVRIGTTKARFTTDDLTHLTFTVPAGAEAGAVSVTTPFGTATGSVFGVVHRRTVGLRLTRTFRASGTVRVRDDFGACRAATVRVQRHRPGDGWATIARASTRPDGRYAVALPPRPGRFRALVRSHRLASADICGAARSRTIRR